jgi:Baseplate J-like protein
MSTQFYCKNKDRQKLIAKVGSVINGIDYLEVITIDQRTLKLYFLQNLPGQAGGVPANPPLKKENVFIEGGVRVKKINVTSVSSNKNVLTIKVDSTGDFSMYTLKICTSAINKNIPPAGFDQQLSAIDFSFKINCPNEFDCNEEVICLPDEAEEPAIDYLAKDYGSFNRLMLDRLSTIMPDWKERNAADLQVALIELMAYAGDHLSYYQDAVATEAYLQTARRRISLKRHARLLDYFVHDGCNARVWVQIETGEDAENVVLKKGTVLMTNGIDDHVAVLSAKMDRFIYDQDPVVFETMHSITLHSAHNQISFYTWQDTDCCLPAGSTAATLKDDPKLKLKKGDVLIFEEVYSPSSGKKAGADPAHRHAVRLKKVGPHITDHLTQEKIINIEWVDEDALPFTLCMANALENEGGEKGFEKSFASGNIVLADHGLTKRIDSLKPSAAVENEIYYPELSGVNNTVAVAYNHEEAKVIAASVTTMQDTHKAMPVVSLQYDLESWTARQDLLGSDRFATEFVVEIEKNGSSFIRFGDDICGKKPAIGFKPRAVYRTGNGNAGNVGEGTINTIVFDGAGILKIRNPLAALGGTEAETMEEVRQFAPRAFRTQQRAVTAADYVEKTELHTEVQKAAAKFYWTGSWYTVYVIIDRKDGKEIDAAFKDSIKKHLEQYRMAGYDLEIRAPRFVPLNIVINVCVKEGYFKGNVKAALLQAFSSYDLGNGKKGFFHPDNFTFGQPVYLSAVYKTAMEIPGVASVEIKEFKRWAKNAGTEIHDGFLQPSELEIIRLDNDASLPENGKINFIMLGGL